MVLDDAAALTHLLTTARHAPTARERFLKVLVTADLWTLLHRAPGEGAARPEDNLIQWQHQGTGAHVVPAFTAAARFPHVLPAPAVKVRVRARVLLELELDTALHLDPLDDGGWLLDTADRQVLAGFMAADQHRADAHGRTVPWEFRFPQDAAYPLACALAGWFIAHGRVDIAYLYEVNGSDSNAPGMLVLALEEPLDVALADALLAVAQAAGALDSFAVRFLPREPAHRAGLAGLRLPPFYVRAATRD